MLWRMDDFRGYAIQATDGSLGSVHDLLFDDARWMARYVVVDTAPIFGRRVLIAATALGHPDKDRRTFPVGMTREQVRESPEIDFDSPVGRRQEADLHAYYGWVPYWAGGTTDMYMTPDAAAGVQASRPPEHGDPHLRSERAVRGYDIHAEDGHIGHVADFLVDEDGWRIRYMMVDTRNWWAGKHVLISPEWVRDISWTAREVRVGLTREAVRASPEYRPEMAVDRAYEERLHRHYGQTIYWGE